MIEAAPDNLTLVTYRRLTSLPLCHLRPRIDLLSAFVSFDTFRGPDNAACIRIEVHLVGYNLYD
jgi:hypothetical protein